MQAKNTQYDLRQAKETSQAEMMESEVNVNQEERAITWSMFLGNPATTTKTIRDTLRIANKDGLAQLFTNCSLFKNIRVFDYESPDKTTLAVTHSFTPELERTEYQQLLPSFAYPPWLLQDFGSEEEIQYLFNYIGETYLSTKYQESRDWQGFLKQKTTLISVTSWIAELSDMEGIQITSRLKPETGGKASALLIQLFSEKSQNDELQPRENIAEEVVNSFLSACLQAFPDHIGSLGFPITLDELKRLTPYELAVTAFNKWETEDELVEEVSHKTRSMLSETMHEYIHFCVQAILYKFNVQINPKYRSLFVSDNPIGQEN